MSTYGEGQRKAYEVHPVSSDICMQKFLKYAKVLKRKFLQKHAKSDSQWIGNTNIITILTGIVGKVTSVTYNSLIKTV